MKMMYGDVNMHDFSVAVYVEIPIVLIQTRDFLKEGYEHLL